MYRINNIEELTIPVVQKMVQRFRSSEQPRLNKLQDYYLNKTNILSRVQEDETKPNNKIVHPYAQYITDTLTGYFMGEPVSYSSPNQDIDDLKTILDYNDEQDENVELAKAASIYGVAWEYIYIDEDGNTRFCVMDTKTLIPVYSASVEDELLAMVRIYDTYNVVKDNTQTIVEVYTATEMTRYILDSVLSGIWTAADIVTYNFGFVPFVCYKNNEDETGDFEGVMSLIDAYDSIVSDGINDYDYFCDAYLALYGYTADSDDIARMKKNRVLLMDQGTDAEFLTKDNSNSSSIEAMKNRIEKDIHKFSKTPDANDESFSSNTSGVAMKYKLLGTENLGSLKERKFKKGLVQRLEYIADIMGLEGQPGFNWLDVDIAFTRNLPVNESDIASMVQSLNGIVSKKTLVEQLPFVEDPEQEIEQLQKENQSNIFYVSNRSSIADENSAENANN